MKNAEQWMETAVNGEEVQRLIPLGYQPTLPRLCRSEGGFAICFFYYRTYLEEESLQMEAPEFALSFDPAGGEQAGFCPLPGEGGRPLDGSDGLEEAFAMGQWAYLEELDRLLNRLAGPEPPGPEELEQLRRRWLEAHPRALIPALARLTGPGEM